MQKRKINLREIARALGVAQSTIWYRYILKKKETLQHRKARKTPKVAHAKILSFVKKKSLITSKQEDWRREDTNVKVYIQEMNIVG